MFILGYLDQWWQQQVNKYISWIKHQAKWSIRNTCGSSDKILNENIAPAASNLCNTDDACVNAPIQIYIQFTYNTISENVSWDINLKRTRLLGETSSFSKVWTFHPK